MSDWQPPATAPKDCDVLVYIDGARAGFEYMIAHTSSDDPDGDWYPSARDYAAPIDMPITAWMALPDPPEGQGVAP